MDGDAARRERDYSPSSVLGSDYEPYLRAYAERSATARTTVPGWTTHRYGEHGDELLDVVVPDPSGRSGTRPPIVVYFHGGYWQELSRRDSLFAAPGLVTAGVAFAAIDYTLAPHATLAEIVEQCRRAVGWIGANHGDVGIDPERIVLAGSSAGAHLAAMVALGLAAWSIRGCVLLSGVYDLTPLVGTSINDAVGLDVDEARRMSPLTHVLDSFPPTLLAIGANEPSGFREQHERFAGALRNAGVACEDLVAEGRNHFDVVFDLGEPTTVIGAATLALVSG